MWFPEEKYMLRCLELADKGKYQAAPNPLVGSVIVHNDTIIGEGFHEKFGENHAERNAILSVKDKELLKEATIYVNLEPCSHFGKTPPCADLIIKNKIPRVVICNPDPFEKVAGSGIKKLQEAGIEVQTHFLSEQGRELNKRFFTFHEKQRPYIILKWAETRDGFISRMPEDGEIADNWISSKASKQLVHLWRSEESGILVGRKTVQADNPQLTCREVEGKSPVRIVLDRNLELRMDSAIFQKGTATIIFNAKKEEKKGHLSYLKLNYEQDILTQVLSHLHALSIQSIIVEGGRETLNQFIAQNLWDEARVFVGNKEFEKGIRAPKIKDKPTGQKNLDGDTINYYQNSNK